MRYYIIAGEASGDLHGSNLMKGIREKDPDAQFRVWGGDLMEGAGGELVMHYRDLAFMGFWEVVQNLGTILRNMRLCKRDVQAWRPDVLILIDFPGFNLRIARWARKQGLRVFYYISPQIWAWHSSRVHKIKEDVERMYVILPFEEGFFAGYGCEVDYVGHPLLDVIDRHETPAGFRSAQGLSDKPLIALLPGSRRQEIKSMLEEMVQMVQRFPGYQFVIAGAPSVEEDFYRGLIRDFDLSSDRLKLVSGQTYNLVAEAQAALVTSGTATLETALLGTPQVVCYKGSPISYWLARRLVQVPYISLVNLVVEKEVVRELIQQALNRENLQRELTAILDGARRQEILKGYAELRRRLGEPGASARAGRLMVERLRTPATSG